MCVCVGDIDIIPQQEMFYNKKLFYIPQANEVSVPFLIHEQRMYRYGNWDVTLKPSRHTIISLPPMCLTFQKRGKRNDKTKSLSLLSSLSF